MASNNMDSQVTIDELPITFKVKYIGYEPSNGLWGIKYTRRPVDIMVDKAKQLTPGSALPICELQVTTDGIHLKMQPPRIATGANVSLKNASEWHYPIDTISYGVQDLVYTRVFAMIIVNDEHHSNPFDVHGFVCDSRAMARRLTYALAAAFQDFSRRIKENENGATDRISLTRQRFAIDLRSPEELADNMNDETEA